MKITDIKIVANIPIRIDDVRKSVDLYHYRRLQLCQGCEPLSEWYDYRKLPTYVWMFLDEPVQFTASVVSYVAKGFPYGLNRRSALKILSSVGLLPPKIAQIICLANQTIQTDVLLLANRENKAQLTACPVSFNPEYPDYYYFGVGRRVGQFSSTNLFGRQSLDRLPGDRNLYFHSNIEKVTNGIYFQFPLLLGIKPA